MSEKHTIKACEFLGETDKAVHIRLDGEAYWIPFSQVDRRTLHPDGRFEITMSAWIAKQKGII